MDRLQIVYSDERVVVVDKPAGLLSVPPPKGQRDGSAHVQSVLLRLGVDAMPVHRIDQETSGLLLCARDAATRELLMNMFKARGVTKSYLAVVQGNPRQDTGSWIFPIKDLGAHAEISPEGQHAETRWKVIERAGVVVLMELELVTGRHNQARLHAAHVCMPLAGETKYAMRRDAKIKHKRCALHAGLLELTLPWETEPRRFESPLPQDMRALLDKARAAPPRRKDPPAPSNPAQVAQHARAQRLKANRAKPQQRSGRPPERASGRKPGPQSGRKPGLQSGRKPGAQSGRKSAPKSARRRRP